MIKVISNNHEPCLPINIVAKYIKQNFLRESSKSTLIIEDFNTSSSELERSSRQNK